MGGGELGGGLKGQGSATSETEFEDENIDERGCPERVLIQFGLAQEKRKFPIHP